MTLITIAWNCWLPRILNSHFLGIKAKIRPWKNDKINLFKTWKTWAKHERQFCHRFDYNMNHNNDNDNDDHDNNDNNNDNNNNNK